MAVAWIPYIAYLIFVFTLEAVSDSVLKKTKALVIICDIFTVLNGAFSGLIFILGSKGRYCKIPMANINDTGII